MGKYYLPLGAYIEQHKKKNKNKFDFISRRRQNQNQLLDCIANYIQHFILNQVKRSKFFSVTMDTTFDNSKREQLSFVLRYISSETGVINERLICMQECANITAQNMFLVFKSICDKNSLQWTENLIGQSYDGLVTCMELTQAFKL